MAATSNDTLSDQSHCTICLESMAVRTNVTLGCCHTFHLDCLGSAFNAANAMRCPVCRAVEDGVWRTFPIRDPRRSRATAHTNQENAQEPPVQLGNVGPRGRHQQLRQVLNNLNVGPSGHHDQLRQVLNNLLELEAPDVAFSGQPIFNNRASAGSLFGSLAGAAPVGQRQDEIDGSEDMSDGEDSADDPPE